MALENIIKEASHPLEAIIKASGVIGVIAIAGVAFLMFVVYMGQQDMNKVHTVMIDLARQQLETQEEANEIMSDIRYAIKANNGVTFRNAPDNER